MKFREGWQVCICAAWCSMCIIRDSAVVQRARARAMKYNWASGSEPA